MKFEYVRWKKYEKQVQKLEGWISKDKLNFDNNYQEIITTGLNVSETNEWLTVAYSLCKDEYLYPIQICKANIIERQSFNTEKEVVTDKVLSKEQEEYAKKDVADSKKIIELEEKFYNEKGQNIPSKYIDLNGKSFNLFCLYPYLKEYTTHDVTKILTKFIDDYGKYTQKELFKMYPIPALDILQIINILIENGIIEKHGKHWRTKKGLIVRESKRTSIKSDKLTKEQEQFIIDNYEKYTQIEFAEYFGVKKPVVADKINKFVKKGIIPKHERGWTRYNKEYQKFHGIKKEVNEEEFVLTEEQQDTLIKYYNMGIKVTSLAEQLKISAVKTREIINSLVSQGKVLPRIYYLGHYVYYKDDADLEKQKEIIKSNLKRGKNEESFKKSSEDLPTKVVGNENTNLLYTIPYMGGVLRFDPPINKKELLEDYKTMSIQDLATKYVKQPFIIQAILDNIGKKQTTIKYLLDKSTDYKWVFKKPLVIEDYLKDKSSMTFEQLRAKYKLSPKVFKMLDSFLARV